MCEAILSLADRHPNDPRTVDVIAEQILHKFCKRRFGRKSAGGRVAIVTGSAANIGEACARVHTLWTHMQVVLSLDRYSASTAALSIMLLTSPACWPQWKIIDPGGTTGFYVIARKDVAYGKRGFVLFDLGC